MVQRQTFDIQFYCRNSKTNKNGLAPIEVSICLNGQRVVLSLQRKETPADFKQAMSSKKSNPIKEFCDCERARIQDFVKDMKAQGIAVDIPNLTQCLKRGSVTEVYTLGDMFREVIESRKKKLVVGDMSPTTYKKYFLAKEAFYAANSFTDETPASSVTLTHIEDFQVYLRKSINQPTAYNYHTRVKMAFRLAFESGKIKATPYAGFKMNKGKKADSVALTEEELKLISETNFQSECLETTANLFLFLCYSGMAYSDMARLKKGDFTYDDKSELVYVEKHRKKTDEKFISVILPKGKDILEKYNYQLPSLSNQKMNLHLKEIQGICRITKLLHTHLGRATYISYLYNHNVSPEIIKIASGHSQTSTLLKYYAVGDKDNLLSEIATVVTGKKPKEKVVEKSVVIETQPESQIVSMVQDYLDATVYKEKAPVPSIKELTAKSDKIVAELVLLKKAQRNDEYRTAFAKCCSNLYLRSVFFKKKIATEKSAGNDENVRKLQQLQKSTNLLVKELQALDARLFTSQYK